MYACINSDGSRKLDAKEHTKPDFRMWHAYTCIYIRAGSVWKGRDFFSLRFPTRRGLVCVYVILQHVDRKKQEKVTTLYRRAEMLYLSAVWILQKAVNVCRCSRSVDAFFLTIYLSLFFFYPCLILARYFNLLASTRSFPLSSTFQESCSSIVYSTT